MENNSNTDKIKKILVTGTKGKTTVCNMINHIILTSGKNSILVDTLGSFYNNNQTSTYEDSIKNFGKSPNVMPGRYLYWHLLNTKDKYEDIFAVLEAGLGCHKWGTGVKSHDIGIFTNVYRDHLDFEKIKSEQDLYKRKSFIFKNLKPGGTYVTSIDNKYTKRSLKSPLLNENHIIKKAVTLEIEDTVKLRKIMSDYGLKDIYFVKSKKVVSLKNGELYDLTGFRYFFGGSNKVMAENLMFATAALDTLFPVNVISAALDSYMLPLEYGRFLIFSNKDRYVVIDYAHEPESLKKLINYAGEYLNQRPYVITRLAPDRNDEFIKDYADSIAKIGNILGMTIYDKIDGKNKFEYKGRKITRKIGESSEKLEQALLNLQPNYNVKRILNEQDSLNDAIKQGYKTIIIIFGDLTKTLEVLKTHKYKRIL